MKNLNTSRNSIQQSRQALILAGAFTVLTGFIAHRSSVFDSGTSTPVPVSRWNQLSQGQRQALADGDTMTYVTAFHSGLCNGVGVPILADIQARPAPNAPNNTTLNNMAPARWGQSGFFNGRATAGASGNQYCFTFSDTIPISVNSSEHRHFHGAEHIRVRAYDGTTQVPLSGNLNGSSSLATASGSGTMEVHFAANGHEGLGLWWQANTGATPANRICVEYYSEGPGDEFIGLEPFTIELEGSIRCLFDDPLAAADPANPTPGNPINDDLLMTKHIADLAPTTTPGHLAVALELTLANNGAGTVTSLQITEDLADQLPQAIIDSVGSPGFNPTSSASTLPNLNTNFDGVLDLGLFDGSSGALEPGQTVIVQLVLFLNASEAAQHPLPGNMTLAFGTDPDGRFASATSDAAAGAPGDTGGPLDYTLLLMPSVNLSKQAYSPIYQCSGQAANAALRIDLNIANTGNTRLDDLLLSDDLAAGLGSAFVNIKTHPYISASTATADPTVLPGFTGKSGGIQIFNGTGGQLDPGQFIHVTMIVEIDPDAAGSPPVLSNQAYVGGIAADDLGNPLPQLFHPSDLSDNGNLPTGTNPGFPGDTGGSDDPTLLLIPGLQAARNMAGVAPATSGAFGNFDVIVETIVFNTGNVPLENFSITDALQHASNFGSALKSIVSQPVVVAVGAHGTPSNASANPGMNTGFAGNGDLLSGGGILEPGQQFVVQYRIEIDPNAPGAPAQIKTTVTAFAEGEDAQGSVLQVSDISDSGFTAGNNPGQPGDTNTHCDPTPLGNCWSLLSNGLACNDMVQVSIGEGCVAGLVATMVLEGEPEHCASDELLPTGNYFTMMVTTPEGLPVPDEDPETPNVYEISGAYTNQTLTVKVIDVVYENSCWGKILLKDKMAPVIDCVSPVVVPCDTDPATLPAPSFADNCDPGATLSLVGEQVIDNDICDDDTVRIRRIYRAVDNMGNTSPACAVIYALARTAITFPKDITWHCEQFAAHPLITAVAPVHPAIMDAEPADDDIDAAANLSSQVLDATGSGTLNGSGPYCGYVVSHSDAVTNTCGNSFQIKRTWTVIDGCANTIILTDAEGNDNVQYIKVSDKTPPLLSVAPITVNANVPGQHPQYCSSQGFLPPPVFSDACNDVTIQILTPAGEVSYANGSDGKQGGFIPSPGLGIGTHQVSYIATDACGNQQIVQATVTVTDSETPQPVCDGITSVTLSSDGFATVFAQTFDDGTTDNCCLSHFEVRRMSDPCDDGHDDTVFGPSVKFCCSDAGSSAMVVFRAFDCYGNFNDCMVSLVVNDKTPPSPLFCPPGQRITCDWYQGNLETQLVAAAGNAAAQDALLAPHFGQATFIDNCGTTVQPAVNIQLDQCLEGTIARSWTAGDGAGNQPALCTQTIQVDHVSDWVVSFPSHLQFDCMDLLPDFGSPQIFFETCELIAVSYEDKIFNVVPDACYKIVRQYAIINWCVLGTEVDDEVVEQPESELGLAFPACDLDGDGDCDDRTFRDSWRSGPLSNRPTAAQATQATNPDTDTDSDPWDGFIYFEQVIKVVDSTKPVFTVGCDMKTFYVDTTCQTTILIDPPLVKDCSSVISVVANGDLGAGLGPFVGVGPGEYTVTFTAFDNCNNSASCQAHITVLDTLKPTPFCLNGLVIELMVVDTPMVIVHVSDFDKGSFDNCDGELLFSFTPDVSDSIRIYTCDELGIQGVDIWVTDQHGNQDYCFTTIEVQSNMGQCGVPLVAQVSGSIATEDLESVEQVPVMLSGQWQGAADSGTDGVYRFEQVPLGYDLTITPNKNDDFKNGVSTFDLVLISRHILGVEPLGSPYKIIAADANRSRSVTSFDLVELRRLILSVYDELPANTSWRFVPEDFAFPDPADPFATTFPEVININNLPGDVSQADFVAIKVGDVNGSAHLNSAEEMDERSTAGTFLLAIADAPVEAGQTVEVAFKAKDFKVSGFQFSLHFDAEALVFDELLPGIASPANFGFNWADKGLLTVSWNDSQPNALDDGTTVFSIRFRVRRAGRLSDWLFIASEPTAPEAYAVSAFGQYEWLEVALVFEEENNGASVVLYPNLPNPFRSETTIGFYLPTGTKATLSISDAAGRTVKQINGWYESGYHETIVRKEELGGNGVYSYRLETPHQTAIRRMVLLE